MLPPALPVHDICGVSCRLTGLMVALRLWLQGENSTCLVGGGGFEFTGGRLPSLTSILLVSSLFLLHFLEFRSLCIDLLHNPSSPQEDICKAYWLPFLPPLHCSFYMSMSDLPKEAFSAGNPCSNVWRHFLAFTAGGGIPLPSMGRGHECH